MHLKYLATSKLPYTKSYFVPIISCKHGLVWIHNIGFHFNQQFTVRKLDVSYSCDLGVALLYIVLHEYEKMWITVISLQQII